MTSKKAAKKPEAPATVASGGELVPVQQHFLALRDTKAVAEVAKANFGERKASAFDLERIRLGAQGSKSFVIADALEGEKMTTSFEGVITFWTGSRVFWKLPFEESGGGSPPDCASIDLKTGFGDVSPAGTVGEIGRRNCADCPHNQWGSGKNGIGKACRETVTLFVLRSDAQDNFFPSMLVAPPGSLKPWNTYMMGLLNKGIPFYAAMHEFTLERESSQSGIAYSQLRPRFVRRLTGDEAAAVAAYGNAMRGLFGGVLPEQQDVDSAS